jgi:membrane protease YdiL (CAAX protease family)
VTYDPNGFDPADHIPPPPREFRLWTPQPAMPIDEPLERQPNLGYAAMLLVMIVVFLALVSIGFAVAYDIAAGLRHASAHDAAKVFTSRPKASIFLEAITFGLTLLTAYVVFPRMWRRPFGDVLSWNTITARVNVAKLLLTGVVLSIVAQALESFLTLPKEMPVDEFFKHPSDVWIIAIFGTLVAPVCEEIFFRGFLLRGFAIFYDWVASRWNEADRERWAATGDLSRRGLIFSGILTSGLFAAMHAAQLGWAWNAVGVLWVVGGVLTIVRLRFGSVAASATVHAAYNGFLFVVMFFLTDGFRHLDKLGNH